MTLREQIPEDLKQAMKNKDAVRLSVIRMVKAAVMNQEIAKGHPLSDAEVFEVLAKEVKQRQDVIPEYQKAGRAETVESLTREIQILQEYLPAQLSEAELTAIIRETIAAVGAAGKKDFGKVMTALMPQVKGRADGKEVNRIVNALIGA